MRAVGSILQRNYCKGRLPLSRCRGAVRDGAGSQTDEVNGAKRNQRV